MLHRAARAVLREDPTEALASVRWVLAHDPQMSGAADRAELVRKALPELERVVRARLLTQVARLDPGQPEIAPGLLADLIPLLDAQPEGHSLFTAVSRGDLPAARQALAILAGRDDLAPRLAHHLALIFLRAAQFIEEQDRSAEADVYWKLSWRCWLQWAARTNIPTPPAPDPRRQLLRHLLDYHRRRVSELLTRNQVDRARRHWEHALRLPSMPSEDIPLAQELHEQAARFREELATEYLLTTREAMRYGAIAEGWRADYEKGLIYLRRLLSLDRENVRLLTALLEICADWFLDCYHNDDALRLGQQVNRYTPFALQLARLVEGKAGELAARAALADFYKFRGFIAPERERQTALYREALRFNPANENVRQLLADMGVDPEAKP